MGINGPEAQQAYFANFQNDPGYQATLNAGLDAIGQGSTAAGNYRSGNTLRALMEHGQRQQYGQFQDRLGYLGQQQGQGINIAGRQAGISTGAAGNNANFLWNAGTGAGNANASGIVGAANARTAGQQNVLGVASGALSAATGMPINFGAGGGMGGGMGGGNFLQQPRRNPNDFAQSAWSYQ